MMTSDGTYLGPKTLNLILNRDAGLCVDCRGKLLNARADDVIALLTAERELLEIQASRATAEIARLEERDRQRQLAPPPATWRNLWGWL